jgi:HSP20 family protein
MTISNLQRDINRLFDDFFDRPFGLSSFWEDRMEGGFIPKLDISDTDQEIMISMDLPGMDPEDIDLSISGKTLTIRGKKSSEEEQKDKQYYRRERSYGSFTRSVPLPGDVDADKIDASYKRGVLAIHLPKLPDEKSSAKKISIKKG